MEDADILVLGFCTVDVSETTEGPIFSGQELEHKCAADWDAALYRVGVGVGGDCGGQQGSSEGWYESSRTC